MQLKKKLDAEVSNYVVFGACNPRIAFEVPQAEPRVGAMLQPAVFTPKSFRSRSGSDEGGLN